jgi:AAA+ superfamily predicted ATPase
LIALRVSSLLTEGSDFSGSISEFLGYADRLGAILLLDEADVILESRSYEDIKRNGMVSGKFHSQVFSRMSVNSKAAFLQTLEYFNGIMFMTTNRIGTMDHAFQSRIQYATEYTPLSTNTRRKIWKVFIERLENDDSREDLLDDMDYLKNLKLNGRQIRNAMKLAQSLAIQESREMSGEKPGDPIKTAPLKVAHVRQAAQETQGLQEYFSRTKESSQQEIGADLMGNSTNRRNLEINIRGRRETTGRGYSDEDE